jgi:hypothetical protein
MLAPHARALGYALCHACLSLPVKTAGHSLAVLHFDFRQACLHAHSTACTLTSPTPQVRVCHTATHSTTWSLGWPSG